MDEVSRQGKLLVDIISRITNENRIGAKFKNGEFRRNVVEPQWICPEVFEQKTIELLHCSGEWLQYKDADKCSGKVILQLHGGGYIGAMKNAYRTFAGLYCEVSGGAAVFTPDYRVAPETRFPGALVDAVDAYDYLLAQGYQAEDIVFAGDSAGGNLALALALCLKDNDRKLPSALVLMSPWTDMTLSGESYVTNYDKDPLFGGTEDSMIYNRDYAGEADVRNPYLSPLFGNFTGFPPTLIQVGSIEMLLSDSTQLAARMKENGVKVHLTVYEGMFHEFQQAPIATLPESKRAWAQAGKFLRSVEGWSDLNRRREEDEV